MIRKKTLPKSVSRKTPLLKRVGQTWPDSTVSRRLSRIVSRLLSGRACRIDPLTVVQASDNLAGTQPSRMLLAGRKKSPVTPCAQTQRCSPETLTGYKSMRKPGCLACRLWSREIMCQAANVFLAIYARRASSHASQENSKTRLIELL